MLDSLPEWLRDEQGLGRMDEKEAAAAMEEISLWLEQDAVSYARSSDLDSAEDKRELAQALRGLVRGGGSAELRDQAVKMILDLTSNSARPSETSGIRSTSEFKDASKKQVDRSRLIEYLNGLKF